MAGVDLATIQRISGHKTLAMVMRYTHQTNEHLNNAMGILESVYSGRENVTNLFQKPLSVPKTSPKHILRLNRDTVNGSAYRGLQTIKIHLVGSISNFFNRNFTHFRASNDTASCQWNVIIITCNF
jgi:hypothetical protein